MPANAHKQKRIGFSSRRKSERHQCKKVDIDKEKFNGGEFEAPPRGCQNCFNYLEEISRLTKIIQGLKSKVSYYESASTHMTTSTKKNPYKTFVNPPTLPKHIKPEKSPSFNRRNTTLHVYPPSVRPVQKQGNPCDWWSPDVLVAPRDYYSVENSGPSSDESETEEEEEPEKDRSSSRGSSVSSRASYRRQRSQQSDAVDEEDESYGDGSVLDEDEDIEEEQCCSEWEDVFPYEENLFHLSRDFDIEGRIATAEDAIVYKAIQRSTGEICAIKFRDEWNRRGKHPKELRLLSAAQGHPAACQLVCWHNLPNTKCHAIVTKLYANTDIEVFLFGNPVKTRRYMHDLLEVIKFLHLRNVLYRDVKPSNVLWDEKEGRATLIDFDVATFFNPERLHRRCVGTDGYMAPEILMVSNAFDELEKDERYQNGKNREEMLSKLPIKGYGLEVDVYSCGVLFGQLVFCYPEEDITDDDNLECSGEGMTIRATKLLAKLRRLEPYEPETERDEDDENEDRKRTSGRGQRRQSLAEYQQMLALDLLISMLKQDPKERCSVAYALNHPFFTDETAFKALVPLTVPLEKLAISAPPSLTPRHLR